MMTPRQEAQANQRAASDPAVSAFVAASAGSGKTRLLTDRLSRLMVGGAKPERILCLTFTKAGAAEMSLRLQSRLGEWVTMDDPTLTRTLLDLAIEPSPAAMKRARSLFAEVLDLPGGMRISTIHAFCQSLLRRFPLEAGLSPHFQLAEDRDAAELMTEATERLLASVRPRGESNAPSDLEHALKTMAGAASLKEFGRLTSILKASRGQWRQTLGASGPAARRRLLGVTAPDRDAVIANAVRWPEEAAIRDAAREIELHEKTAAQARTRAEGILAWLGQTQTRRAETWPIWRRLFLKADGLPFSPGTLLNPNLGRALPEALALLIAEAGRVAVIDDSIRATDAAALSDALCYLARPLLDRYETRKDAAGLLEYNDLIQRSTSLMVDPGAAWVLYKLDGGLDHLLLDEVQDTAPEQWDIAHALTQEFFVGDGAYEGTREEIRTVFAVGDRKQSIFSFQGADVAGFETARSKMEERVRLAGRQWVEKPLNVSFRSTSPVLALVDAVFADPDSAAGVVLPGDPPLTHRADRAGHAGQVDLWPLAEAPPPEPPQPWSAPDRYQTATSAIQVLVNDLAEWIRDQTSGATILESKARPVRPGDIMVLVRHRDALPAALVRALKALNVPVAGLDRMVLTEQPAVQDLLTLGDTLLLPRDDLSFACFLTSPLGGLNDDDLMALAIGGDGALADVLRDRHRESPAWTAAWSFFSALLSRADYVTPHVLLAEALGAMGGRAKLLARLGSEAAEPVDELLNAALRHARLHPPSLQGFLQWVRRGGAEVKREADSAGDRVRILTVHGAKGLQAPIVILPDTTGMPKEDDALLWGQDPATGHAFPLWLPRKEFHSAATVRLREEARQRRLEEHNRLLYVALTRAEDRLIVCGAKPRQKLNDACWYSAVARGFARLVDTPEGDMARLSSPQTADPEPERALGDLGETVVPPSFLGRPPPAEPARPSPLAPSRPEGADLGGVPASASPLARVEAGADRFRRGQLIHALLQHLPSLPEAERYGAAVRFLKRPGHDLPPGAAAEIADETMAVLTHPALAPAFGPDSRAEVPLTGLVGDAVVGGLVDRLAVLPDRLLLVDFKTNRRPPATAEATPAAYLRQMASYRAVLRAIFPDRPVVCALIWTREARLVTLPDQLLDAREPSAPG